MDTPRLSIAFVKEACYQDLWVGAPGEPPESLAMQTHLRLGPLALLSWLGADFFILTSNYAKKSNKFRRFQLPFAGISYCQQIESRTGESGIKSQTERVPLDYAIEPESIKWNKYDVVISVNFSVPYEIRVANPSVTWICLPGEGNLPLDVDAWHYVLSHNCPGFPLPLGKLIDMPYTLLEPCYIENSFGPIDTREGIYLEINSCFPPSLRGDWRSNILGLSLLASLVSVPISYHPGTTSDHVKTLLSAKYFVKLGGRPTRGISFLEAMSAGLVCFLRQRDCYGGVHFPEFCYFRDVDDLAEKIKLLERSDELRVEIIEKQRERMREMLGFFASQLEYAASNSKPLRNRPRSYSGTKSWVLKRLAEVTQRFQSGMNLTDFGPVFYEF